MNKKGLLWECEEAVGFFCWGAVVGCACFGIWHGVFAALGVLVLIVVARLARERKAEPPKEAK